MTKLPLERQFSAGGVVYKKEGDQIVWVVQERAGYDYWQLPKGHIEKDEKAVEAAIREVKEESGVEACVITKIDDEQYFYAADGKRILKHVSWFLMEYTGGSTEDFDPKEVSAVRLLPYKEAYDLIKYDSEKRVLEKAQQLVNTGDFEAHLG